MSKRHSIFNRGTSIIALAVAAAAVAPSAFAQAGAAATKSEEIVVTGSHLGKSAFSSPTPVNVIGDERMKALANPSLADTLNQIPSFRAITTPSINSFRIFGNIGARAMDLRGLGVTRTLVLLDGKRVVPSSDNGSVDLNSIPSSLVKRSEVVTGGASAAYGADAVAGVVNIILDTKFTGFKTDISAGAAAEGDGQNYFASFAAGRDFAGGRGHWILGAEAQKERGLGGCATRDFCDKHTNYPGNAGYISGAGGALLGTSTNGLPATLVRNNVEFTYSLTPNIQSYAVGTTGGTGLIAKGQQQLSATQMVAALKNTGIAPSGALTPFVYGGNLNGTFMLGGDANFNANDRAPLWGFSSLLVVPTKHFSSLGHVDFDVTSNIQASAELMVSSVTGRTVGGVAGIFTPTVKLTSGQNGLGNPFLPANTRAALIAADPALGVAGTNAAGARVDTTISFNVTKPETGQTNTGTSFNQTYRGVFGLKGDLDTHDMKWDVSYEYGKTDGLVKVQNARLATFDGSSGAPYNATDAITPPAGYTGPVYFTSGGAPVICAQSVVSTNQYNGNGCIPVNLIGTLTPQMLAAYYKPEWATRSITQNAAAANLTGTLFEGWAGPVTGAVGAEWRKDTAEGTVDALTRAGLFQSANVAALGSVDRTVKEGYLEVSVPLLKDLPFVKSLTIDGSERWTNYSTSGDSNEWKAGIVYEPDDQILLRVTSSSDIRAPTAFELNPNPVTVLLPLSNPFASNSTQNILTKTVGNPNLKNETAFTTTAGIVLKPAFIPGFRVSTDYYDITIHDAIDALTAAPLMNACRNQNLLCNFILDPNGVAVTPGFSGTPSLVTAQYINGAKLHAEGAEIVANYSFNALGGTFDATFNGNYIMDLRTVGATGVKTRLDGVTGNLGAVASIQGVPQYKLDGLLTYSRDNWSVTGHARYIPEGILDQGKVGPEDAGYDVRRSDSIETNRVDSAAYFDLSATYSPKAEIFGGKTQLYGSVNNVFDTSEPDQLRLVGNGVQFDPFGRAFRVGIRANW